MTSHLESLKRQNEHFVRDFLQIPHFQLENRRFRASVSYKVIFTELKKHDFCEASASFHDTHQMLRLPRYLQGCHVRASLPLRCAQTAPSPHHQMLRLPRHRERPPHKVLRLPRKNDTLALTHCQSIAPVTQNTKMTSHFVIWNRQNEHFVRDFLHFSHFEGKDWIAMRINDATTTTRRRDDDDTTTTQQNNANTGPTPDPNYKREPFATHSGIKGRIEGRVQLQISSPQQQLWSRKTSFSKLISHIFLGWNFNQNVRGKLLVAP